MAQPLAHAEAAPHAVQLSVCTQVRAPSAVHSLVPSVHSSLQVGLDDDAVQPAAKMTRSVRMARAQSSTRASATDGKHLLAAVLNEDSVIKFLTGGGAKR
jgi:hypothetical protein